MTENSALKMMKVKLIEPKLLNEILIDLEEQIGVPILSHIKNGRAVVLINGKTTTDLMYEVKFDEEVVVLPVLRGG